MNPSASSTTNGISRLRRALGIAGAALVAFDRALVAARGLDATVAVTVLNSDAYASVRALVDGPVASGAALLHMER